MDQKNWNESHDLLLQSQLLQTQGQIRWSQTEALKWSDLMRVTKQKLKEEKNTPKQATIPTMVVNQQSSDQCSNLIPTASYHNGATDQCHPATEVVDQQDSDDGSQDF